MTKFNDINLLSVGHTIQLTGAILSGEGKNYLCFFPGAEEEYPVEVLELGEGEWGAILDQTDKLWVETYGKDMVGKVQKAILRKSQRQIEASVSWRVFKRDGYRCRYCGRDDVPLTVDHLVLWEEGGPSTEANLVAACKKCNRRRGNTPYAQWLQSRDYHRASQGLTEEVRRQNQAVSATLDKISRVAFKRSR